jgi:DNA-binding response OmpR family regulator
MQNESPRSVKTTNIEDTHPSIITVGPIRLDTRHLSVSVDGKTLRLTPVESRVLQYLATHANTVCTSNQIGSSIWGPGDSSLIKVYIHHLRQKIEPDPMHPIYLLTIPEAGYMLVSNDLADTKQETSIDPDV